MNKFCWRSKLSWCFILLSALLTEAGEKNTAIGPSARERIRPGTYWANKGFADKEWLKTEIFIGEVKFLYNAIVEPETNKPLHFGNIGVIFKTLYNWNVECFFHPSIKIKEWKKAKPLFDQPLAGIFVGDRPEDNACFGDLIFDFLSEEGKKILPAAAGIRIMTLSGKDYFLMTLNIEPEISEFEICLVANPYSTRLPDPLGERWVTTEQRDAGLYIPSVSQITLSLDIEEEKNLLLYNQKCEVSEKSGCFFSFLSGEISQVKAKGNRLYLTVKPSIQKVHLLFGEFFGEHYSIMKERIFKDPAQYQKMLSETDWRFPLQDYNYESIRKDLLSLIDDLSAISEEEKNRFMELDEKLLSLWEDVKNLKILNLRKEREYLLCFDEVMNLREKLIGDWMKVLPVK